MYAGVLCEFLLRQPKAFSFVTNRPSEREARESDCLGHAILLVFRIRSIYRRSSTKEKGCWKPYVGPVSDREDFHRLLWRGLTLDCYRDLVVGSCCRGHRQSANRA